MANIKAVNAIDIVAPVGDKRTEKTMEAFVLNGLQHYKNGKTYAHVVAVEAILWAAESGSAALLNLAYKNIGEGDKETNDQSKLRHWFGKATAFQFVEKGEEKTFNWVGFRAKADGNKAVGFFVKKGERFDTARTVVDGVQLREGERFYDAANKSADDYDLLKLLAMLQGVEKKADGKAEKNAFVIPADVKNAIVNLVATAKAATVTVQ